MTEVFDAVQALEVRTEKFSVSGTPAAQQTTISDPAACAAMTATLTGVDTGTDMTAAQAATIVADLAALKTAVDANNAAIDSLIDKLQAFGLIA